MSAELGNQLEKVRGPRADNKKQSFPALGRKESGRQTSRDGRPRKGHLSGWDCGRRSTTPQLLPTGWDAEITPPGPLSSHVQWTSSASHSPSSPQRTDRPGDRVTEASTVDQSQRDSGETSEDGQHTRLWICSPQEPRWSSQNIRRLFILLKIKSTLPSTAHKAFPVGIFSRGHPRALCSSHGPSHPCLSRGRAAPSSILSAPLRLHSPA